MKIQSNGIIVIYNDKIFIDWSKRPWVPKKDRLILNWVIKILNALTDKFPNTLINIEYKTDIDIYVLPIVKCFISFPELAKKIEDPAIIFYLVYSMSDKVEFVAQVGESKLTLDELIGYMAEKVAACLNIQINSVPAYDEKNLQRWLEYNNQPVRAP